MEIMEKLSILLPKNMILRVWTYGKMDKEYS